MTNFFAVVSSSESGNSKFYSNTTTNRVRGELYEDNDDHQTVYSLLHELNYDDECMICGKCNIIGDSVIRFTIKHQFLISNHTKHFFDA